MDPLEFVARLAALALVVLGPVPITAWALRRSASDLGTLPFGSAHLAAIVAWTAGQVGLGLVLGVTHLLRPVGLLGGEILLLAVGIVLWRRDSPASALGPLLRPAAGVSRGQFAMLFAVSILALSLGWVSLARCVENFDSLAYHLPIMARWTAEGWFARFDELGQTSRYPLHGELLSTLLVLPWRSDLFVAWPNLLSWLHLGLAVTVLARRLGASTEAATAAAVLLLACPTLLERVGAIQPDIAVAAFFVTAIVFVHASLPRRGTSFVLWSWLTLAVLVGLKTSALGYAGLAVAGGWILAARSARGVSLWPARGVAGVSAAVAVLVLAGFWYVRNWIQVGNPLGLVEVKVAGLTLLEGPLDAASLRRTTIAALFDVSDGRHWRVLGRVARDWLGLPGAALAAWALSGAIVASVRRRVRRSHAAFVAIVGLAAFVAYWNSPYSGDNGTHGWQVTPWIHVGLRYAYPLLAVVAVAAALGMKALRLSVTWLAPLPVVVCLVYTQWTVLPGVWPLRAAVLVASVSWWLASRAVPYRGAVTAVFSGVVIAAAAALAIPERAADRIETYGRAYEFLEEEVAARAVVGAVNVPRLYPLFGEGWSRHVVDATPEATSRQAWVAQLVAEGIEVMVVGHAPPRGEIDPLVLQAQQWVRQGPPFELLRDVDSVRADLAVYRLQR